MTPAARKPVVQHLHEEWQLSERRACGLADVSRMAMRYTSRRDDTMIRTRLRELAAQRRRWGYRKLHVLLRREGVVVNHKRVERIYREEGLSVRRRKRKRAVSAARTPLIKPTQPDEVWGTGLRLRRHLVGQNAADADGGRPLHARGAGDRGRHVDLRRARGACWTR